MLWILRFDMEEFERSLKGAMRLLFSCVLVMCDGHSNLWGVGHLHESRYQVLYPRKNKG